MSPESIEFYVKIAAIARDITISGGLVVILFGGARKVWVWGWQLKDTIANCDKQMADLVTRYEKQLADSERRESEWRELALEGRQITRTAVDLAKRRS